VKDRFGSFVLLLLWSRVLCEFGIFSPRLDCKFSDFWPAKNLQLQVFVDMV